MKNQYFPLVIFLLLFPTALFAQVQTPTPPVATTDGDVVKVTTKLVQIDAIVTDKNGKPVTDLKSSDFELLQDGKPQIITNLSYVNTDTRSVTQGSGATKRDKTEILPPPEPAQRNTPGRLVTFVVDDGNCSASTSGMLAAKAGLKKFISEQMAPGDRVAIYQTRAGSSIMQQYTSDKAQLLRSADKIRWYPPAGSCAGGDGSYFEAAKSNILDKIGPGGMTSSQIESDDDRKTRERAEDYNRNNQVTGTIGVLNYVVRGLERVGGRRVVFVMSDGIRIRSRSGEVLTARDALHDVAELANRAGVVFDTIDVRGVYSTAIIEARDEVRTQADVNSSDKTIANRDLDVRLSEDGMYYLADLTGGAYYKNSNDLDVPIRHVLSQESGYYLIAYEPSDDTFRGKHFNKIEVRIKRPELTVKSRPGFDAVVDQPSRTVKHTAESDLYEAIASPLPNAGLSLQLTAYFGNSAVEGDFVRSLIHLQGDEITFTDDPSGMKKAVFDVVAVTLDEKNKVVDEFTRTHTFKIQPEAISMIRQNGLIYTTDVPVKKAGTYNFRIAVRDDTSQLIGSSSQMIEIPDLKKGRLYLSGLNVSQVGENGKFVIPGRVKPENALVMTSTSAAPAIRQFRRGSILAFSYTIYNAQLDRATQMPNVSVQMKLFHNGQLISDGKPTPSQFEKQADWSRIIDYSNLRLNSQVDPGDYTLQIIVRDIVSNDKTAFSSQWIDFEVIP